MCGGGGGGGRPMGGCGPGRMPGGGGRLPGPNRDGSLRWQGRHQAAGQDAVAEC